MIVREIEFRVYDRNQNKILYIGDSSYTKTVGTMLDYFEDEDLMQYTGLKDKNGKKIYEGDILESEIKIKRSVIFKDGCFGWMGHSDPSQSVTIRNTNDMKIIGNIYENKELIESYKLPS